MNNYSEKFEKMRIAGKVASKTLDMITDHIKPGITTEKIDQMCYEFIKDNGGHSAPLFYRGYKKSVCTSLNHVICHGIPSDRTLEEGDILNIDVTAIVNDYYQNYIIAKKAGVNFLAYRCKISPKEIKIEKKIKIIDE